MSHCTSGQFQLFKKYFFYSTEYKTWLKVRLIIKHLQSSHKYMREYGTMYEDSCSGVGKENKGKKWVRV